MSPSGSISRYEVHRDRQGGDLAAVLRQALAAFYRRHRCLPAEVVVHKGLVEQARAVLCELEVAGPPLRGSGGCLAGEVWLGIEQ